MKVTVETDEARVEVYDRVTYSPDVLEDMVNRAVQAAVQLQEALAVGDDTNE